MHRGWNLGNTLADVLETASILRMDREVLKPTDRFTERVADYVRYRPSYPSELLDFLDHRMGGLAKIRVADVGAGTGHFTRLLLERGARVDAIEPNQKMRQVMVDALREDRNFREWAGTAEETDLPSGSVELVTCAQAFHWFDPQKTRQEFARILKPSGEVALIWNEQNGEDDFGQACQQVRLRYGGRDYQDIQTQKAKAQAAFPHFFGVGGFQRHSFGNFQDVDRQGLIGRYASSSYFPRPEHPDREKATQELERIFDRFQQNGMLRIPYRTELFIGRL